MDLIDSRGRLFGLVNLVDMLVVLVALAVVVAGVALVAVDSPSPPTETTSRYVTLDLGTQPAYVATLVSEGDSVRTAQPENLTITDVYATETDDGRHLHARALVTGETDDDGTLLYDGDPLRVGRDLSLTTADYATSGTITDVDATNPGLPVVETDVLLRTNLSTDTVDAVQRTDEYRIDGRTVGTVRSVTAYRTADPGRVRAYVGVTYHTYRTSDGPQFAGTPVREGAILPVETDAYAFEGEVVRRDATEQRGQASARTVTLELANADPDLASSLRAGMAERVRGETVAELTNVSVEPATMVLTSQDGNVYRREHPVEEDVILTAELQVRETNVGAQFKGAPLRQGRTVVLDFGTVTVEATVVSIR